MFFKFSFTHITPQKIKSDIKDRDKMELPLAILVVVGVFEAIRIAFTCRYILPIYPVATTALSKPICVEDATIPIPTVVKRWGLALFDLWSSSSVQGIIKVNFALPIWLNRKLLFPLV